MFWLLGLLCIAALINGSIQKSTPESSNYTAAVVEYIVNPLIRLDERTTNYISFINQADAENVDIIVFPEGTLTDRTESQVVPDASDKVVPCDNDEYVGNPIQRISCAARDKRIYVVINLAMQRNCTVEREISHDNRPCAVNNLNVYNTNVVFDRNGTVISIYRKVNLFGEPGINTSSLPDVSWFDTDFDVRFGHFIFFDMLFNVPGLQLIDQGIKNYAYSTRWFSEIPFLTAVQIQLAWAYKHNVNFLAAGANNPNGGNTGSGIYSGKQGIIKAVMLGTRESRILISEISKIPGQTANIEPLLRTNSTPAVFSLRDQLDPHTHVIINSTDESEQIYDVCHDESKMCCHFALKLAPSRDLLENTVTYSYVAAAYHGNRTLSNGVMTGEVLSCSVFACTNNVDIRTCGVLYPPAAAVVNHHRFTQIKISGVFPTNETMITPTTLDISLLPLSSHYYEYVESKEFLVDKLSFTNISMELTQFDHHLLTFGIYSLHRLNYTLV